MDSRAKDRLAAADLDEANQQLLRAAEEVGLCSEQIVQESLRAYANSSQLKNRNKKFKAGNSNHESSKTKFKTTL